LIEQILITTMGEKTCFLCYFTRLRTVSLDTQSTDTASATIEDLHAWHDAEDWPALAEFVARLLSSPTDTHRGLESDATSDLMVNLLDPAKAAKLWTLMLKTCTTVNAVENYLRKKIRRDDNRLKTPRVILSFRSHVRKVLRDNTSGTFCCEHFSPASTLPLYGLTRWESCLTEQGSFCGNWIDGNVAKEVRMHAPLKGNTKSQRIENGCSILLDAVRSYSSPAALARGFHDCELLSSKDIALDNSTLTDKDQEDLEQSEDPSPAPDEKELWFELDELFDRLDQPEKEVARLYSFPKWIGRENPPTLHQIGRQLGVSHQTIDNRHKKIVAATRALLKELGFDNDLAEWTVFLKFLAKVVETQDC